MIPVDELLSERVYRLAILTMTERRERIAEEWSALRDQIPASMRREDVDRWAPNGPHGGWPTRATIADRRALRAALHLLGTWLEGWEAAQVKP